MLWRGKLEHFAVSRRRGRSALTFAFAFASARGALASTAFNAYIAFDADRLGLELENVVERAVLLSRDLKVTRSRTVGKDNAHLKLTVSDGGIVYSPFDDMSIVWHSPLEDEN